MRRRLTPLLLSLLLACATAAVATEPLDQLVGTWALNEDLSDDNRDAFDGKLKRSRFPVPQVDTDSGGGGIGATSQAQANYWDTLRKSRERRSLKDLSRLGSAYPLLTAQALTIGPVDDGIELVYDDKLPRRVVPNPGGRTFSASGEELTRDTIGYTLTYWDEEVLTLETDPPQGGKYIERLHARGDRLEYSIKLRLRVLEDPVTVTRVFERR